MLLFLTAMIWGFAFVAQFFGAGEVGPFAMNGLRFPLGTLSILPVMFIFERKKMDITERKKTVKASLLIGAILFCATTLQQIGIIISGVGVASIITGLYTVFIPITCYVLFKQKTGLNVWIAAVLAVSGVFLLCMKPDEGFQFGLGELLLLIGAFLTLHMTLSGADIKGAWGGLIVLLLLLFTVNVILSLISVSVLNGFTQFVLSLGGYLTSLLILSLIICLIVMGVSFLFRLIFRRR